MTAAFPSPGVVVPDDMGASGVHQQGAYEGMELRDWFAGKAMAAMIGAENTWRDYDFKPVDGLSVGMNSCLCAYHLADMMMVARQFPKTPK